MLTHKHTANPNGKLFADRFCDVEISNPIYYPDNHFQHYFKSIYLGVAKIIAVRSFRYSKISDSLSYQVCGMPAPYLAKIIKSKNHNVIESDIILVHIIWEYTIRNYEAQTELLNDWWNSKKPEGYDNDR